MRRMERIESLPLYPSALLLTTIDRFLASRIAARVVAAKGKPWNRISITNAAGARIAGHAASGETERRAKLARSDGGTVGAVGALAAVEEEEITPETAAALDPARASLARGEGIPHEEILREFGLKQ